ncbi:MAG: twin-arginine translocation signal domain-containing protein [archaeon]
MNRRDFLKGSGGLVALVLPSFANAQQPRVGPQTIPDIVPIPEFTPLPEPDFNLISPSFHVVACNNVFDFNGDHRVNYPHEAVGIKNEFRVDEALTVLCLSGESNGKILGLYALHRGERKSLIPERSRPYHLAGDDLRVIQQNVMPVLLGLSGERTGPFTLYATLNGKLAGKVEIDVNGMNSGIKPGEKHSYSIPGFNLFTANDMHNLQNDGVINYPEDFQGLDDRFFPGEPLRVMASTSLPDQEGKRLDLRVFNTDGRNVYRTTSTIGGGSLTFKSDDIGDYLLRQRNGGVRDYIAVAYVNGRFVGLTPFEIKEKDNTRFVGPMPFHRGFEPIREREIVTDCSCR